MGASEGYYLVPSMRCLVERVLGVPAGSGSVVGCVTCRRGVLEIRLLFQPDVRKLSLELMWELFDTDQLG